MIKNVSKITLWVCVMILVTAHMIYCGIILIQELNHSDNFVNEQGYAINTELVLGDADMGATVLYRTKFQYFVEDTEQYYTQYEYTFFKAGYKTGDTKSYRVSKNDYKTKYKEPVMLIVIMIVEIMIDVFGGLVISRRGKVTRGY